MPLSPARLRQLVTRMRLPAEEPAAATAGSFIRASLTERIRSVPGLPPLGDRIIADGVLLAGEAVAYAVRYAGAEIEVICTVNAGPALATSPRAGPDLVRQAAVLIEVVDRRPAGTDHAAALLADLGGDALRQVRARSEAWGVTHRGGEQSLWFRLDTPLAAAEAAAEAAAVRARTAAGDGAESEGGPAPAGEWAAPGGPSFLAEASELLTGQLDEDMVAALAGQLLVPRLADWCAVWLTTGSGPMRLSRVWHTDERRIDALRRALEQDRPTATHPGAAPAPWPWPHIPGNGTEAGNGSETADAGDSDGEPDPSWGGSALAVPLIAAGTRCGVLLLGRAGTPGHPAGPRLTATAVRLAEDVGRRVAQAVVTARQYTREAAISRVLQRSQLPAALADIPGVDTAVVYEPYGEGQTVGGDFYDVFPLGNGRWSFLLGDVSGHDLEAMSATGMARHLVRMLAREGHGVERLLGKLNQAIAEETAEAQAYSGDQTEQRFLSLLYGELEPDRAAGTVRCTLASAGHPLPLHLGADGSVTPRGEPRLLLGIDPKARFRAECFELAPGETLLCVTDGVTERRNGDRQLDDNDGLAALLRDCTGLGAAAVAERVRSAAYDFDPSPLTDDLTVLVLEALSGRDGIGG
ncbi:PP2C family protein-serine/threonine phosphatase [Streptomyces sp. NPDC058045]|uniref:PP2C family protein-serine/threonine phosphatase n=1 Tax=Streptomyces sp. NPDC058045 TaxID=3346311 RepID=UPI0036EE2B84